ncbi:C25 family cysteine peptidase, partial [Candidatus Marinimicrobia bacterium]|nr:C25 family cysteine peptidase [Candidatus Neomarinimicrobiota bacterium]
MNFFIKSLFFLILSFNFSFGSELTKIFKVSIVKDKNTEIIFEAPAIEIVEDANGFSKFTTNDEVEILENKDFPELPIYSSLFQMNPGSQYTVDFEVVSSYFIENINFEANSNNALYPLENISLSDPLIMRGLVLGQLSFIPYKYSIEDKRLEVYETVQINITETGTESFDYFLPEKRSYVFEELYENFVVNYERSDRSEDYQIPSILYICGGNSISNAYFQDLVEWRHKQGYIVTVVSTSESGSSESAINNYITNAYNNWDNPPEIVGLIGDVGGSYDISCDSYNWSGYSGASDVIYSYVEGNDLLPEVIIGRISANGTNDLYNIINKTIQYEKAQQQTDLSWFNRAGLIGDPTTSGLSCAITNQYIEQVMVQNGLTDVHIDIDGGGGQLDQFLIDELNRGIMYYNYRGYYYGSGSYPPSSNQISNGYYTPFVTTLTCGTGDFNGTSSSESFVRLGSVSDPKGAVAAVGTSTTGTHTAYNNIVNMGLYEGIFSNGITHAGTALTNGRITLFETYPSNPADCVGAFAAWNNLIGDPALHLWTDTPKDFSITYPSTISLGSNHLDLIVLDADGNTVENARVTLLMKDNGNSEEPDNNTFVGQYYAGPSPNFGDLVLTRDDNLIDFNWGNGSPDAAVPNDDFQVRWTTTLDIENAGLYSFRSNTDDGVRLYIDNELIIEQWIDQGPTSAYGSINLTEGSHECVMEYFENGGGANASLYWTPPGATESLVLQNGDGPIESGDAIFATKLTDSNGRVNFSWDEYQEGDLYVTAIKRNYRPHEGVIAISATDGYAIVPDYENLSNYISDSNGDGILTPGESIDINIPLSNIGLESMSSISATLSASSDLITITDSESTYDNIEIDQDGLGDGFSLEVSSNAIFNDDINLILDISYNNSSWSFYVPLDISSPKININSFTIIDGSIDSGSSATINLEIQNNGNLAIEGLTAQMISPTNLISILDSELDYGNLDINESLTSEQLLSLSFNESIFKGSVFPLEVKFSSPDGYNRSEFLNLTVGEINVGSPLGPDLYGYYIYDSGDTDYELAPDYNWIEIDPGYPGGDGINFNLSDSGNGDGATNSTTFVNLPFTFYFYGEGYNRISVSTNGWVGLGRSNLLSFRNYPIPGAGGPSPMIAAFWDDMKTQSGGDVFYKTVEIDGEQSFIIEWSDMRTYDNNSDEDFQIILSPNPNSETGDGNIKIQYKTFNNTSNGSYPSGGTPIHGCYATIGIENKYGNEGLQYTFNNEYPTAAMPLSNGTAILITTEIPDFGILGDINEDDIINVLDVVILVNVILSGEENSNADINQDGIINVLDI